MTEVEFRCACGRIHEYESGKQSVVIQCKCGWTTGWYGGANLRGIKFGDRFLTGQDVAEMNQDERDYHPKGGLDGTRSE